MLPKLNLRFLHTSPMLERLDALTSGSGSLAAEKKELSRTFLYLGVTSPNSRVIFTRASPTLVLIAIIWSCSCSCSCFKFLSCTIQNSLVRQSKTSSGLYRPHQTSYGGQIDIGVFIFQVRLENKANFVNISKGFI